MPEWKKKTLDDASKKMEEVWQTEELKNRGVALIYMFACVLQETLVMLNMNTEEPTTAQVTKESSKPVQRAHDPR